MSREVEEQAGTCQFDGGGIACKVGTVETGIAWGRTGLSGKTGAGRR